jgi:hypothetical protein
MTSNTPLILGFGLAIAAVTVGVWGAKGTRGLDGFGGGRRRGLGGRRTTRQIRGHAETSELKLFIDNDGELYRSQTTGIQKQLVTRMARGNFNPALAEKAWMHVVERGAKKYVRDVAGGGTWHQMFSMADRKQVAKELNDEFMAEAKYGNYDSYLPKKYQKQG